MQRISYDCQEYRENIHHHVRPNHQTRRINEASSQYERLIELAELQVITLRNIKSAVISYTENYLLLIQQKTDF